MCVCVCLWVVVDAAVVAVVAAVAIIAVVATVDAAALLGCRQSPAVSSFSPKMWNIRNWRFRQVPHAQNLQGTTAGGVFDAALPFLLPLHRRLPRLGVLPVRHLVALGGQGGGVGVLVLVLLLLLLLRSPPPTLISPRSLVLNPSGFVDAEAEGSSCYSSPTGKGVRFWATHRRTPPRPCKKQNPSMPLEIVAQIARACSQALHHRHRTRGKVQESSTGNHQKIHQFSCTNHTITRSVVCRPTYRLTDYRLFNVECRIVICRYPPPPNLVSGDRNVDDGAALGSSAGGHADAGHALCVQHVYRALVEPFGRR